MIQSSKPLHEAIWKNDESTFTRYLEKGEDLNTEDEHGLKPLCIAVMTSNEMFVKYLLSDKTRKVEIDAKTWCYLTAIKNEKIIMHLLDYNKHASIGGLTDDNGLTPLHHAVINRNPRLICSFLARDCEINKGTKNGYTPLHFATVANDLQTVVLLLDRRASVNIKTVDGYTALHLAIRNRHIEAANLLMAMGGDVNNIVTSSGSSALHIAVENNDESMIELLLQNGANIMHTDHDGKNILHIAAEHGYENWMKFFVDKGIDINSVTNDNSTPLLIALQNKKEDTATMLLDRKANVNIRNKNGLSPIFIALQDNNTKIVKRLVTLKAKVNDLTIENSSILHFAVKYCDKKMVVYLLQRGAKLGVRDSLGQNELHLAVQRPDNSDMLQHLLKLGLSVNEVTFDRSTALHYAVSSKSLSRNNVEVLTKNGINIDAENASGDTALNIICRSSSGSDRYNIIEHLLIAKADPNHVGSDKEMPLCSCIKSDNISTALLLAKHGACSDRANSHGDGVLHLLIKFHCGCACTRMAYLNQFLSCGADINSVNEDGETPLHTSLRYEKHESLAEVQYLLNKGARMTKNKLDENVLHMAIKYSGTESCIEDIVKFFLEKDVTRMSDFTKNRSTVIHYAARYSNNSKIMKLLLDKADSHLVHVKDDKGKTPLHLSAASGAKCSVKALLEHDAEIDCKDNDGNSAIHLAIMGNHIETVKSLLQKGASTSVKNKEGFSAYDLAEQKDRHIYQLLLNR